MYNQPNGLPQLDDEGLIPENLLPEGLLNNYKGVFATEAALVAEFPTGETGDYAYISATSSYWYWSDALTEYVNQEITATAYLALSTAEKAAVPYIIVV